MKIQIILDIDGRKFSKEKVKHIVENKTCMDPETGNIIFKKCSKCPFHKKIDPRDDRESSLDCIFPYKSANKNYKLHEVKIRK